MNNKIKTFQKLKKGGVKEMIVEGCDISKHLVKISSSKMPLQIFIQNPKINIYHCSKPSVFIQEFNLQLQRHKS